MQKMTESNKMTIGGAPMPKAVSVIHLQMGMNAQRPNFKSVILITNLPLSWDSICH
jgi:hypothetical protein